MQWCSQGVFFLTKALADFLHDSMNLGSQDSCMHAMLGLKLLLRQLPRCLNDSYPTVLYSLY